MSTESHTPEAPSPVVRPRAAPRLAVWIGLLLGVLAFGRPSLVTRSAEGALEGPRKVAFEPWDELPTELEAQVAEWTDRLLSTDPQTLRRYLARQGAYAGMIRERLRARGMPDDLLYLAMVESGLRPRVMSPDSALGIWQLREGTARDYGLRVDEWVDERRDPIRATDAALDYLQALHDRFGSWPLAAAAYNAGPTRVARLLRRHGPDADRHIYWEVVQHLPRETRDYVPRILASRTLAQRSSELGLEVEYLTPYQFDRVLVPGGTSLWRVAERTGVEYSVLRELNPHFLKGVTPPGSAYPVRVPRGRGSEVVAALTGSRVRGTT